MSSTDNFEYDNEDYPINPNTGQRFRSGDLYNGKVFLRRNEKYLHFVTPEAYKTKLLNRRNYVREKNSTRTVEECIKKMMHNCKTRAGEENGQVNIDIELLKEDIEKGYLDPYGNLITHYKIETDSTRGPRFRHMCIPSLDRIDNSCPDYIYTRERKTCLLVPWGINNMRSNFDDDINLAKMVYPWAHHTLSQNGLLPSIPIEKPFRTLESISQDLYKQNIESLNNEDFLNCSQMWIDSNCM